MNGPFFFNQYVVYENPKDFPGKVVVREWIIKQGGIIEPGRLVCVENTLEDCRKHIPEGMVHLPRFCQDDPCIVEVWT